MQSGRRQQADSCGFTFGRRRFLANPRAALSKHWETTPEERSDGRRYAIVGAAFPKDSRAGMIVVARRHIHVCSERVDAAGERNFDNDPAEPFRDRRIGLDAKHPQRTPAFKIQARFEIRRCHERLKRGDGAVFVSAVQRRLRNDERLPWLPRSATSRELRERNVCEDQVPQLGRQD